MSFFFVQLLNGISYGFILFLLAVGLTLIFGLMRIVNLAHGSYYLFAGYLGYSVSKVTGNFALALLTGIFSIVIVGVLMERFLFRILYKQELQQILLTFGFIYIFQDICHWIWAGQVYILNKPAILVHSINFFDLYFPSYRLVLVFIGLIVYFGLWYLQEKTVLGAIIRAGVDDKEMLSALGINVGNYFTFVFGIGAALAGLAGVLGAPFICIYPGLDLEILILALVVIVIGGLGSQTGALFSSLLIGLTDAFGKAYIPQFAMFTVYVLMVLILIFRPWGMLGRMES